MAQLPDWKRPVTVVTDAAQVRQTQARTAVIDLFDRTRNRVGQISARGLRRSPPACHRARVRDEARPRNREPARAQPDVVSVEGIPRVATDARHPLAGDAARRTARRATGVRVRHRRRGVRIGQRPRASRSTAPAPRSDAATDYLDDDDDDDDDLDDLDGDDLDVDLDDDLEIEGYGGFHIDRAAIEHADIDR